MNDLLYANLQFVPQSILDIFGLLFFIILVIVIPGLIKIILKLIINIDTKLNWVIKELKHKEKSFEVKDNDNDD